jgi:C4-dicarboxylate transporter
LLLNLLFLFFFINRTPREVIRQTTTTTSSSSSIPTPVVPVAVGSGGAPATNLVTTIPSLAQQPSLSNVQSSSVGVVGRIPLPAAAMHQAAALPSQLLPAAPVPIINQGDVNTGEV